MKLDTLNHQQEYSNIIYKNYPQNNSNDQSISNSIRILVPQQQLVSGQVSPIKLEPNDNNVNNYSIQMEQPVQLGIRFDPQYATVPQDSNPNGRRKDIDIRYLSLSQCFVVILVISGVTCSNSILIKIMFR